MRCAIPDHALTIEPRPDPRTSRAALVKLLAPRHGLAVSAVASVEPIPEVTRHVEQHIRDGHTEGMSWFSPERAAVAGDLRNLHPSARSVISLGLAYWPGPTEKPDDGVLRGRISRYAWGRDYHRVLKRRMRSLHADLEAELGLEIEARFLVDTARVFERAIAARSGLGWFGKHACTIVPGHGSWVLLGELLTDLDLPPDSPLERNCGQCRICIARCPTGAIVAPYTIHAPTCISYLTIEERGVIPYALRPAMGDWVYGCDVCQEVCPYTGAARPVDDDDLKPKTVNNAYPSLHWLLGMTDDDFALTYFGTPVPRTKRRGLARNAAIALGNIGTPDDLPVLARAVTTHDEPLVRGHAAWAIGQLGQSGDDATLGSALRSETETWVIEEIRIARNVIAGIRPRLLPSAPHGTAAAE